MKRPITVLLSALMPLILIPAAFADEASWDQLYQSQVAQPAVQNSQMQRSQQAGAQTVPQTQNYVQNQNTMLQGSAQNNSFQIPSQNFQNNSAQSGYSNAQSMPVLNSAMVQQMAQCNQNSQKGVDILDESMRYHNNFNTSSNGFGVPNSMNGNMGYGQMMPQQSTMSGGMGQPCYSLNNCTVVMPGAQVPNAMQSGVQNNVLGTGLNTQQVGVMGAAALMGVYLQQGGLGGMLKSVGWDGKRHIMGQSIGGY